MVTDLKSSSYIGTVSVNSVECHRLALRAQHVDSQIWIATSNKPLPMKYVITSKWVTGAPQFAVRFRIWNTKLKINANTFRFVASKGAKKLDAVPVNEIGEMMIEGIK